VQIVGSSDLVQIVVGPGAHVGSFPYCSSLTFSIQSTFLPPTDSWMAMCRGRGRSAVPVFQSGRKPYDVAGTNLLDRAALALHPTEPGRDDQRLPERMGVPGRVGAGFERDLAGADAGRLGRLEQRVRPTVPVNQSTEPFWEGWEPFLLMSISIRDSFSSSDTSASARRTPIVAAMPQQMSRPLRAIIVDPSTVAGRIRL
jgi:hypothetical protein